MWLTRVSILRPVAISMFVLALVLLGYQSLQRTPVDLYPDISFPFVTVLTVYPGAGPEEVEDTVTKPIEDAVSGISNLKSVTSTSSEGVSVVGLEFYIGTNVDVAASDVRERVASTRRSLPRDIDDPVVRKFEVSAIPVVSLAMSSPRPPVQLRKLADDVVKYRLGQLPGVAAATVAGGDVREIQVRVDKGRLDAYGLSISQINQILAAENLNIPAGTVKEPAREFAVRAVGQFPNARAIEDVRIPTPGGTIRMRDIATVGDSVAERDVYTRLNGNDTVAITIQKQSGANTVAVVDAVRSELERLTGKRYIEPGFFERLRPARRAAAPILPKDVNITVAYDQSQFIKDTLAEVRNSLLLGALLAVLVVFFFLHTLRGTFIVALAIPTSLMATFVPVHFAGFTLNMMVLLAMSLSVGILVDDSIVVLENIYRHLSLGEPPREAAFNGRTEIGLAAITITMVDVVVFVPIAFMGGIVGQFFRQFGITVACATLFSLFVSFTLTPMLASRWAKREDVLLEEAGLKPAHAGAGAGNPGSSGNPGPRANPGGLQRLYRRLDSFYSWLDRGYRRTLAWALDNRLAVMLIGPICLFGAVLPAASGKTDLVMSAIIVALSLAGIILCRPSGRRAVAIVAGAVLILGHAFKSPLGAEFMPRVDQGQFSLSAEMPAGTSLTASDRVVRRIEQALLDKKQFPEIKNVFATVGSSAAGLVSAGSQGANYSELSVVLVDKTERKRTLWQVMEAAHDVGHALTVADIKTTSSGMGGGGSDQPLQLELTSDDSDALLRVADRIEPLMAKVPGTTDVDISWRVGKPELRATVDRIRAASYGLTSAQIASALRTSIEGSTDTRLREAGKEYDIRVRLRPSDRRTPDDIADVIVGTTPAGPVRLREVANLRPESGPTKVDRKNRQRMVAVTGDVLPGYFLNNVRGEVDKAIQDVNLETVTARWGGEVEQQQESSGYLFSALFLSIGLVFILMAALFESLLSPFVIMFSLPMALVGGLLALIITNKSVSIVSMVGFIMLVGLVGKNAILLVDYTNTLRTRGYERNAAVLEAGPTRLRPILMTTLAMIFGMLPTALALGRGSEFRAPMAIAVIGGLILSTLLTLVFIPTLYTLVDDLARKMGLPGVTQRTEAM
jgi:HAE1 family hydrophobic/amphiphilic exporter-1